MTKQGKCDTCRSRKVRCDEKRPKCSACKVKNRPCTYNYGKVKALVREDPNQFSGHGKAKTAPRVYPLVSSYTNLAETFNTKGSGLRLAAKTDASAGGGSFQTFALNRLAEQELNEEQSPSGSATSEPLFYSERDSREWSLQTRIPPRPSSAEEFLRARFVHMPGPQFRQRKPLFSRESWMDAIACRIGHSEALDLAVEYAVNSFEAHREATYSKTKLALLSRSKALKSLRRSIDFSQEIPSFDVLLATKLHSFAEVFVAVETFSYTTHCLGLAHLLRAGSATGLDQGHYWSLVDNTYLDEVSEAVTAGRPSIFDTEHYRNLTDPATFDSNAVSSYEYFFEGCAIMHCLIQLPRLVCQVRYSLQHHDDTEALDDTLKLAKLIWEADPYPIMLQLFEKSTTVMPMPSPYAAETEGIIDEQLSFDSVQTIMLCTRYWTLRIYLAALLQSLVSTFPIESITANLPDLTTLEQADINAGISVAQSLTYCLSFSASLPMLPLRLLGPLYGSLGSWHRMARRLQLAQDLVDPSSSSHADIHKQLEKAKIMQKWVLKQINSIHDRWGISHAEEHIVTSLIDCMAGGEIPGWVTSTREESELRTTYLGELATANVGTKQQRMKMAKSWTEMNKAGREGLASMSAGVDVSTDDSSPYGSEAGGLHETMRTSSDTDPEKDEAGKKWWRAINEGGDEMKWRRFDFGFGYGADAFAEKEGMSGVNQPPASSSVTAKKKRPPVYPVEKTDLQTMINKVHERIDPGFVGEAWIAEGGWRDGGICRAVDNGVVPAFIMYAPS